MEGFIECNSKITVEDPQCSRITAEYAIATGCATACVEAVSVGPRNEVCNAISDNSEATCSATEITTVCPNYSLPKPPPPPPPTPLVQPDPAPEHEPVDSTEDVDTTSESGSDGGSGTRALAPPSTAASGSEFDSTPPPNGGNVDSVAGPAIGGAVAALIFVALLAAGVACIVRRRRRPRAEASLGKPDVEHGVAASGRLSALQTPHPIGNPDPVSPAVRNHMAVHHA